MRSILSNIESLYQHNQTRSDNIEAYRPQQCPHCGKAGVWRHGDYLRKADYENSGLESLNPVAIPRFYCPHCGRTCSVLPACIPPHRHYPWILQQMAILLWLARGSYRAASRESQPSRWSISRWWRRLGEQFHLHLDHLRSPFAFLAGISHVSALWQALLAKCSLSQVMVLLNNAGLVVP